MKIESVIGNKDHRSLVAGLRDRKRARKFGFLTPEERKKFSAEASKTRLAIERAKREKSFYGEEGPPILGKKETEALLRKLGVLKGEMDDGQT